MTKSNISNFEDNISRWQTPHLLLQGEATTEELIDSETLRKEAYELGFKEGYEQGDLMAQTDNKEKMQTIEALLTALAEPFADINQQVLDSLVTLSGKIARSLVKRELATEPESIMALVRDTVSILNVSNDSVNIHLNPDDAKIIQELTSNSNQNHTWNIIDDPLIPHGDCNVVHNNSLVEGSLQSRINTVITQFQGDERA